MKIKIYLALASCVIALTPVFVETASRSASHDRHQYQHQRQATKQARYRARAQKKKSRRAISYVCPMHPDIREKSRGVCPKCLMNLVAEPLNTKTDSGAKNDRGFNTLQP